MDPLKSLFLVILAVSAVTANSVCPGAPPSAYGNGLLECLPPSCSAAGSDLHPSPDPTQFYQCAGSNLITEMKCAPGTCFSPKFQVCVHPRDWTDVCERLMVTAEPEFPEETTTEEPFDEVTMETTEEIPSTFQPEDIEPNDQPSQNRPGVTTLVYNAINRLPNTIMDLAYRVLSWPWS